MKDALTFDGKQFSEDTPIRDLLLTAFSTLMDDGSCVSIPFTAVWRGNIISLELNVIGFANQNIMDERKSFPPAAA